MHSKDFGSWADEMEDLPTARECALVDLCTRIVHNAASVFLSLAAPKQGGEDRGSSALSRAPGMSIA